jgi:sporulation integral membrane protein YlbJ
MIIAAFCCMFIFPSEILSASKAGVLLWFNQILPTLFPFMAGVNILSGLGFINHAGRFFSPLMRPLFDVPGEGGFALAAGFSSGYPMGAKVTALLRETKVLTQTEAQRLVSFTNNSGPLFILGAVGIGIFNSKEIGYFLLLIHYASAIFTGIIFRWYNINSGSESARQKSLKDISTLPQPLESRSEPRQLGIILSQSVLSAMESMAIIGGLIIVFSVLTRCISLLPIQSNYVLALTGAIEMTNGVNIAAGSGLMLKTQVIISGIFISFSGFSIHAQTASILSRTDIKTSVYILAKILQSFITFILALVFYPQNLNQTISAAAIPNHYGIPAVWLAGIIAVFVAPGFISLCAGYVKRLATSR